MAGLVLVSSMKEPLSNSADEPRKGDVCYSEGCIPVRPLLQMLRLDRVSHAGAGNDVLRLYRCILDASLNERSLAIPRTVKCHGHQPRRS
jgi:hypothetical protein